MNKALESMVEAALHRIATKEMQEQARVAANEQLDLANQEKVVEFARLLLPEAVRELVEFGGWSDYNGYDMGHKRASVWVNIPHAAPIIAFLAVEMTKDFVVTGVEFYNTNQWQGRAFRLAKYEPVDDGDGIYKPMQSLTNDDYETFEIALEHALVLGNNYQAALARALAKNKKAEEPVRVELLMCPLTVAVEGEQGYCMREKCAWWINTGRREACSIKVIAANQLNSTSWEE